MNSPNLPDLAFLGCKLAKAEAVLVNSGHNEHALLGSFCKQFQNDFAKFRSTHDLCFSFLLQWCLAKASTCPREVHKGWACYCGCDRSEIKQKSVSQ